jgi:hypothetical protein
MNRNILQWESLPREIAWLAEEVLARPRATGGRLSQAEASRRLADYGPNELQRPGVNPARCLSSSRISSFSSCSSPSYCRRPGHRVAIAIAVIVLFAAVLALSGVPANGHRGPEMAALGRRPPGGRGLNIPHANWFPATSSSSGATVPRTRPIEAVNLQVEEPRSPESSRRKTHCFLGELAVETARTCPYRHPGGRGRAVAVARCSRVWQDRPE